MAVLTSALGTVLTCFPPKEVEDRPMTPRDLDDTGDKEDNVQNASTTVEETRNSESGSRVYSSAVSKSLAGDDDDLLYKQGDLRTCIVKDLKKKIRSGTIRHQWDLAALVVQHVVTVLFDRFENSGPQVLRRFGGYIDDLVS